MNMPASIARQGTFVTEATESDDISGTCVRRGDIEIPVVRETESKIYPTHVPETIKTTQSSSDQLLANSGATSNKLNENSQLLKRINSLKSVKIKALNELNYNGNKPRVPASSSLPIKYQKTTPESRTQVRIFNTQDQHKSELPDNVNDNVKITQPRKNSFLSPRRSSVGLSSSFVSDGEKDNGSKYLVNKNSETEETYSRGKRVTFDYNNSSEISKMAASNRLNSGDETMEEVLKERNAMIKSEKVYTKRIRQLEEELKAMVSQCQMLSNENKELRKTLDGIKLEKANLVTARSKESEAKLKEMESLLIENEQLKIKNSQTENNVQDLEKQLNSLQKRRSESEKKQSEMDLSIRDLQNKIKEMEFENKALDAKVKTLEYDNKTVTNSLDNKRKEFNELMKVLEAESITEADLKDFKAKFERSQEAIHHVKQEMESCKKMLRESEINNTKLLKQLDDKDNEIQKMNSENNRKDKLMEALRKDLEESNQEIKKLEQSVHTFRDKETEMSNLKSNIVSIKAELDKILDDNQKLKQEKLDLLQTISKLEQDVQDATETSKDSKNYLQKLEHEKMFRAKAETDLRKKAEEMEILEVQLKEDGINVNKLNKRIEELEDERVRLGNYSKHELETDNKLLKDENMKLRQMLVERNIQLTNTKSEQTVSDTRIRNLERKHKNAEDRVKKLSHWLDTIAEGSSQESGSYDVMHGIPASADKTLLSPDSSNSSRKSIMRTNSNLKRSTSRGRGEHLKAAEPQQDSNFSPKTRNNKMKICPSTTITPAHEEHAESQISPSLPMLETRSSYPPHPRDGYFMLYRQKLKRGY